ncbi:30S ribosome-binding factor RbfA [Biomaibacter acetigenes]|uniref:Ribosome-binding factor A n=1 Tax=Biomaibacter acetigenes TaxID=2316383 RepID=A0A3G2R565_9FIRM|nr:30S ribosome-binding factor RbfA [Biomaibacter acetigenes]AYO30511.1 30S ribosome-binding factor RbfA [Biomaibacter acetigenes]MDN5302623.1 ribosome-binding factor [Thermoanaerobacteraceae bacterium]MDN5311903.1 ribosome-binding factor [Thermoanaerobacteraceae bacterium]RKL62054.1 30S ribosome-binding factor RbfA [Thermoanaerobacteraceae bacterium SP2]
MEFSRSERVAEEIKKAASQIINNEIKDPRVSGLISVTKVEMTKDLRHAKIFLSIYGEESEKQKVFEGLKNAEGFIRKELAHRVRMKFIPEISFKIDESIEYGIHIYKLLEEVQKQEDNGNEDR